MITKNHKQEVISRVYAQAIIARCGFTCSSANLDYGVDLTIHDILKLGNGYCESGFKIDLQLKSSIGAIVSASHVRYDLEVDAYNALILQNLGTPRILVVLVLPEDESEWTAQTEMSLELRRCAYWVSLEGMSPSKNKRAVRVSIPRGNLFSIEQLNRLMEKVRRSEKL